MQWAAPLPSSPSKNQQKLKGFLLKKQILVLAGTRPEVIKLAPVAIELRHSNNFNLHLCSTGQHKEMLQQAFSDFSLFPDRNLDVMLDNQSLTRLSSSLLLSLDQLFDSLNPDWLIVQGDTTTVAMACLVAFYKKIKVAHIEAGLRSFDKYAPFPEEVNRRIASVIADLHFAPTIEAKSNLLQENIPCENIVVTGNTVIDSLLWMKNKLKNENNCLPEPVLPWVKNGSKIILITGHRRENFGAGFLDICKAIQMLALKYPDVLFVYPVHLNPNVYEPAHKMLSAYHNIILMNPIPYKTFVALMMASYIILTDSGGVQEEAPSLGKPVLIMREVTERPEGIKAGNTFLVGTNTNLIIEKVSSLLDNQEYYSKMAKAINSYGDGNASKRIVNELLLR